MKWFDIITAVFLVVGGLNWGLVGLFQVDIVATLFGGETSGVSRFVYALVGISALYQIFALKAIKERWSIRDPDMTGKNNFKKKTA